MNTIFQELPKPPCIKCGAELFIESVEYLLYICKNCGEEYSAEFARDNNRPPIKDKSLPEWIIRGNVDGG